MARDEPAVADARATVLTVDAEAETPAGLPAWLEPVHPLHLLEGGAGQHRILGAARRSEVKHGEAREILHRGGEIARRDQAADVADLAALARRSREAAAIASSEPWIVRHHPVDERAPHSERLEDAVLDVARVGHARDRGHDLARESDGEVRVLPLRF